MEGLFFIAMAYDIIKPFNHDDFDAVVKRNADFDAAMNFKADNQHNNNEGALMRADELEILP